ncbi:protease inhibitor I42 family protein [Methylotetracoccus oryzae]|uniref:protease inhibitor I42 family protein n=1 Tax=Methylotetracoccus oryzae TaxID=1919059 RepID=UPI0013A58D9F|nr:protease inhibitor I42 family protein [Methylotetracoccus oryzae]
MGSRQTPFWALQACVVTVAACAATKPVPPAPEPLVVSADRSGTNLALLPGQELVIRLPGNPTTGYRWSSFGPTGSALSATGPAAYEPDAGTSQRVGAGGFEIWRFVATRAGTVELRFEYRRPWETGVAPLQVVRYTVSVR